MPTGYCPSISFFWYIFLSLHYYFQGTLFLPRCNFLLIPACNLVKLTLNFSLALTCLGNNHVHSKSLEGAGGVYRTVFHSSLSPGIAGKDWVISKPIVPVNRVSKFMQWPKALKTEQKPNFVPGATCKGLLALTLEDKEPMILGSFLY